MADKNCLVRTRDGDLWLAGCEGLGNRWRAHWSEHAGDAQTLTQRIAKSVAADVWAVVVDAATGEVIADFDPRKSGSYFDGDDGVPSDEDWFIFFTNDIH